MVGLAWGKGKNTLILVVSFFDGREKASGLGNLLKRNKAYISRWKFPCRYKVFILLLTESTPDFP